MKRVKLSWFVVLVSLAVLGFNATGNAAEIVYQDDISQNLVTKDVLVRAADNAIVLMDGSSSMEGIDPKYKKTHYELAKQALAAGNMRLPDLGYNIGIYLFSPLLEGDLPDAEVRPGQACRGLEAAAGPSVRTDAAHG